APRSTCSRVPRNRFESRRHESACLALGRVGGGMYAGDSAERSRLGPYRIIKRLGIGGTSEVLLALSQGPYGFERTVVIKRLLPKCEWDPSQSRMLAAEAVAYARLTHPAIVRLYDFFAPGGHVALVL